MRGMAWASVLSFIVAAKFKMPCIRNHLICPSSASSSYEFRYDNQMMMNFGFRKEKKKHENCWQKILYLEPFVGIVIQCLPQRKREKRISLLFHRSTSIYKWITMWVGLGTAVKLTNGTKGVWMRVCDHCVPEILQMTYSFPFPIHFYLLIL